MSKQPANLRDYYAPDRSLIQRALHDHVPTLWAVIVGAVATFLAGVAAAVDPSWFTGAPGWAAPGLVAATATVIAAAERWVAQRWTRPEWELHEWGMDHTGLNPAPPPPPLVIDRDDLPGDDG